MFKKSFVLSLLISLVMILGSYNLDAQKRYPGSHHTTSHGGHYSGGSGGSSHKGGHYINASTGNHYGRHKK